MRLEIFPDSRQIGVKSGAAAADAIREAIRVNGTSNIILATGTSQFDTLERLVSENVDWDKVVMFHLDEYIGLPVTHPASFRKYLQERFISKVAPLKAANLIDGEGNPQEVCDQLQKLISHHPIDVTLVGIGENGHLAFNDPPADFSTEKAYIIVQLDEACRRQQVGEGWFNSLKEVPGTAISMSIKQILKSKTIICSVSGKRKALAVKQCVEDEVSNLHPASILQSHPDCTIYLDEEAAQLLRR